MPRHGRFRLSLGLAVGASLAFFLFLVARPASDETVKLTDLVATGGAVLRQKLGTAADGCAEELVRFFQGAD